MKQIHQPALLLDYIQHFHLQDIFSFDISGIAKLCDEGILKRIDGGYRIQDEAALAQLVNGNTTLYP